MTAMEFIQHYEAVGEELMDVEEKIERRHALAKRTTARPLSLNKGSGTGSGDGSMRILEYMINVDDLEQKKEECEIKYANYRACCLYLAEMLPPALAGIITRRYLEMKSQQTCAEEMAYSITSIRRLQRQAEEILRDIVIVQWDGVHVPIVAIQQSGTNIPDKGLNVEAHES